MKILRQDGDLNNINNPNTISNNISSITNNITNNNSTKSNTIVQIKQIPNLHLEVLKKVTPGTITTTNPNAPRISHQPENRKVTNLYSSANNLLSKHFSESAGEILHISLSTKDEVKLNESANAWKPRSMMIANSETLQNSDDLYKQVRSILNKLTFDNFDVLLEQLKKLNIDTMDTLNGVIILVFDKAIDEPKFSRAYAQLCKSLVENCFPVDAGSQKLFKVTLIKKCQTEFDRNVTGGASGTEGNVAALRPLRDEMALCEEPDRKRELGSAIVELEQKLRRRTVCTVGFIGELYRMEMLTTKIMDWCIQALLASPSEEKLECLCKLLATVGKRIEMNVNGAKDAKEDRKNYVDLSEYFKQIKQIADKKGNRIKVSNRVR